MNRGYQFFMISMFLSFFFFLNWSIVDLGFPGGSDGKWSACNVGDLGSIPGLGRSPGKGHGYPLRYSCLESHGQSSLVGYSPWGHKEFDMTEQLTLLYFHFIVDLQFCVSFCCTAKSVSYTYAYIPSFLRFFSHIDHYRGLRRVSCAIH